MKSRPKFRRTIRTECAVFRYYCDKTQRWVIYRTAGGVTRKTSIRGPLRSNLRLAAHLAQRLAACPADQLPSFKF